MYFLDGKEVIFVNERSRYILVKAVTIAYSFEFFSFMRRGLKLMHLYSKNPYYTHRKEVTILTTP